MNQIVDQVRANLLKAATPERARFEKNYHKSQLEFLGAPVPAQKAEAKKLLKSNPGLDREGLMQLEAALWESGVHELHGVACEILGLRANLLVAEDLGHLRNRIVDAAGWAHVDTLSTDVVSSLIIRLDLHDALDKWAIDPCFWVRRASMLALLRPLRSGDLGEWSRFTRYAESMINEKEFFIRKAIGWVVREVSKKNPTPVYEFLARHRGVVSGLTLREGGKYLPPNLKADLGLK